MQDFDIFLSCNSINIWYLSTKRYALSITGKYLQFQYWLIQVDIVVFLDNLGRHFVDVWCTICIIKGQIIMKGVLRVSNQPSLFVWDYNHVMHVCIPDNIPLWW